MSEMLNYVLATKGYCDRAKFQDFEEKNIKCKILKTERLMINLAMQFQEQS